MNGSEEQAVYEMLLAVVRSLVDQPERVEIVPLPQETSITFKVSVDAADIGKLIGVNGRTARALRTILGANAARLKHSFSLDLSERS